MDIPYILEQVFDDARRGGLRTIIMNLRVFVFLGSMFLYVLSPLDIMPEAFFGILGYIDDFLIALIIALAAANRYYDTWQRGRAPN